jgi:hypothetical protein
VAAIEAEVPMTMRKVFRQLERWRSKRKGRSRIPESLWMAAGALAREHGVNPVARVLRLEFNHLKRMAESEQQGACKSLESPSFVELAGSRTAVAASQCMIELQGQRGTMRIEWKGTTADLVGFSRAVWEMIS